MGPISIRERLEELKKNPKRVPKPLDPHFSISAETQEKPLIISKETVYQRKIEKAMMRIDFLKKKMCESSNFLSLYPEFTEAEKEFLKTVDEAAANKAVFTDQFVRRIEEYRRKIRQKKQA